MELNPETLARAQKGDTLAQEEFLRLVDPSLRSLVRRLGPSRDREDQVQGLYAKLLAVLPRFRPDGPAKLSTWVHTVMHRWLLEQKRRPRLALAPMTAGIDIPDGRPGADVVLGERQLQDQLEQAIALLPDDQRRVLVLAQLHAQPLEALAEVEGIPLGTVKSRLHRARAQLVIALGNALDIQKGVSRVANGRG